MPRIAIITNFMPHYRVGFYRRLAAVDDFQFAVVFSDMDKSSTLKDASDQLPEQLERIRVPMWGAESKVSWQQLPFRRLLTEFDVLIISGQPKVLSNIVLAELARWSTQVVIYGQGFSYGANRLTQGLRHLWWRSFRNLILYTDREVQLMRQRGFRRHRMISFNNGLELDGIDAAREYWSDERLGLWQRQQHLADRQLVISVTRLIERNRFPVLIDALQRVVREFPGTLWGAIGSGPDQQRLRTLVAERGLEDHVRWVGAVHDESQLAPWFLTARCVVHPGPIGLTLMHAFAYGVPVVTHSDPWQHGPEFAAFADGQTGLAFPPDQATELAERVKELLSQPERWSERRGLIRGIAANEYNTQVMAERVGQLLRQLTLET